MSLRHLDSRFFSVSRLAPQSTAGKWMTAFALNLALIGGAAFATARGDEPVRAPSRSTRHAEGLNGVPTAASPMARNAEDQALAELATDRDAVPSLTGDDDCGLVIAARSDIPRLVLNTGGPTNTVKSLAFSPDSSRIYTAGLDKVVQVWGLQSQGRAIRRTEANRAVLVQNLRWEIARGLRGSIYTISASPIDRSLAIGGYGARDATGDIILYDTARAEVIRSLRGHRQTVISLSYSPDGQKIASVSLDGEIRIWTAPDWESVVVRPSSLNFFTFQPATWISNDTLAITVPGAGQNNYRIGLVDAANPKAAPKVLDTNHVGGVYAIVRDPKGERWASSDRAGNVFIWKDATGAAPKLLRNGRVAMGMAFGPENRLFISTEIFRYADGTRQSVAEMYDIATGEELDVVETSNIEHNFVCGVSPDGSRFVTWAGGDDELLVYVLRDRSGKLKDKPLSEGRSLKLRGKGRKVYKVAFADNGYNIGIGVVPKPDNARPFNDYAAVNESFDPTKADFQRIAAENIVWRTPTAGAEGWEVIPSKDRLTLELRFQGQEKGAVRLHRPTQGYVRSYCWISDENGPYALAVGTDEQYGVFVYGVGNGGDWPLLRYYRDHAGFVTSLGTSADGKYLVSGSVDQTIKVWSLEGLRAEGENFSKEAAWGAVFAKEGDEVVLKKSLDAGAAQRKGLRVGDRVVAIDYARNNEVQNATDPNEIMDVLNQNPITQTLVFTIDRRGRRLNERILLIPAWEPLMTLFASTDGEWALWSPQGFYDASVSGDELFGWQMNRGVSAKPDFYRADDFRFQLERPAVMRGLLAAGNLPTSLRQNGQAMPKDVEKVVTEEIRNTPVVTILEPTDGQEVAGERINVKAKIAYPDEESAQRVTGLAYVNGSPAQPIADQLVGRDRTFTWSIDTRDMYNKARVVAEDPNPERTVNFSDVFFRLRGLDPNKKQERPKLFILTLACGQYANVEPLAFPVADAEAIAASLKSGSGDFYELGGVIELKDKQISKENMVEVIKQVHQNLDHARPDDLFVVFIAGHGLAIDGKYYFIPTQASLKTLKEDGISWDLLKGLAKVPCRKLFLLDTCHSGNAVPIRGSGTENLKAAIRPLKQDEIIVVSATDANQEAIEFEALGHGIFTQTILEAFTGKADASEDGDVFLSELIDYVQNEVPRRTERFQLQTPISSPSELLQAISVPLVSPGAAKPEANKGS